MTEFEAATLAFQKATIAFQHASLDIRGNALWVAGAQVAATLAIGIGQIAVVWFGIRVMQRAGERRSAEQDQRHTEAMRALEALIARTAPQARPETPNHPP